MLDGLENLRDRCFSKSFSHIGFGRIAKLLEFNRHISEWTAGVDGTLRFLWTTLAKQNFRNCLAIASLTSVIGFSDLTGLADDARC